MKHMICIASFDVVPCNLAIHFATMMPGCGPSTNRNFSFLLLVFTTHNATNACEFRLYFVALLKCSIFTIMPHFYQMNHLQVNFAKHIREKWKKTQEEKKRTKVVMHELMIILMIFLIFKQENVVIFEKWENFHHFIAWLRGSVWWTISFGYW